MKLIVKEDHYIIVWNNLFGEVTTVHSTDCIIGLKNSMHWLSKHFDSYTYVAYEYNQASLSDLDVFVDKHLKYH